MPRRRRSDVAGDYSFAVTVEGPDEDAVITAADVGLEAVAEAVEDARNPKGSTDEDGEEDGGSDE